MKTNPSKLLLFLAVMILFGTSTALARDHHGDRKHKKPEKGYVHQQKGRHHNDSHAITYRNNFKNRRSVQYSRPRHYVRNNRHGHYRDKHRHYDHRYHGKRHAPRYHNRHHGPKYHHKHHKRCYHRHRPVVHNRYLHTDNGGGGYPATYGYSFGMAIFDPNMAISVGVSGY